MPKKSTAIQSPRFALVQGNRGWYKHVPGVGTKYVCSLNAAPTGEAADEHYIARFPELAEVRTVAIGELTVKDVLDLWITDRLNANLSPHTTSFYRKVADAFAKAVGPHTFAHRLTVKHARDYRATLRKVSATTRKNRLVYIKMAMAFAARHGHVQPDFWQDAFDVPDQSEYRKDRAARVAERGLLMYSPKEIGDLLKKADKYASPYPLKLWTLLGINGGLGQSDLDTMTRHHIHGDRLVFPRMKTGIERIIPLWPETQAALTAWLKTVPADRDKLFVSVTGRELHGAKTLNIVTKAFKGLCDAVPIKARGHYSLRRTFRTLTDGLPDRHAIDIIMGHEPRDVGRRYVQSVDHARLVAVTNYVRAAIYARRAT